jgi:hypothetical protein
MKKIRIWSFVLIVLLLLTAPVFAQDDDSPADVTPVEDVAPTEAIAVEDPADEATVVVAPEIPLAEPVAPNETVDVQTWVDDVLEYLSGHTGEIILGVGLLLAIFNIKQPMTADEKAREDAEIARQREEARLTPEPTDDLLVSVRALLHGMRRIEDALPAAQRASPDTMSGDKPTVNVFTEDVKDSLG